MIVKEWESYSDQDGNYLGTYYYCEVTQYLMVLEKVSSSGVTWKIYLKKTTLFFSDNRAAKRIQNLQFPTNISETELFSFCYLIFQKKKKK